MAFHSSAVTLEDPSEAVTCRSYKSRGALFGMVTLTAHSPVVLLYAGVPWVRR
jgi:hypothetical protein